MLLHLSIVLRYTPVWRFSTLLFGGLLAYFLVAGTSFLWLNRMQKGSWGRLRLSGKEWTLSQILNELKASTVSLSIFGIFIFGTYLARDLQITRIYWHISDRGWPFALFSFFGLFVLHDAYFYLTHRLLHAISFLKKFHHTHHLSSHPSPWAAFSFHPYEAILSGFFFPLVAIAFPVQRYVFALFIFCMVFTTVIYHCGYDLFPGLFKLPEKKWVRLFSWVNSTRAHSLHHKFSRINFGLYFTIWDRIFGTFEIKPGLSTD